MTNTDKPVLDGSWVHGARFGKRLELFFASEADASDFLNRRAPTKPLPEAGREATPEMISAAVRSFYGEDVQGDAREDVEMALNAALKAASPQSSVEEGPSHDDYAAIGRATVSEIEAVQAEYPQLADWTPAECYSEIIGDLAEKAFPEQGGREAVHRAMNERDKHWIFALGAFRQLPADEVQAVLARLPALGSFTTPRSEEDIRKAVVEESWLPIETAPNNEAILVAYDDGSIQSIPAADNDYTWMPYGGVSHFCTAPKYWKPATHPDGLAALHSPADRSAS